MSLYTFRSKDGDVLDIEYPIADAPPVGHRIQRGGKVYRRLPSVLSISCSTPITSYTLPSRRTMHPKLQEKVSRWNEDGAPQFDSSNQADRYAETEKRMAEKGEVGTYHTYGDAPSAREVREARANGERITAK